MYIQRGLDSERFFKMEGGGGTESQRLEPTAQAATWEEYERGIETPSH